MHLATIDRLCSGCKACQLACSMTRRREVNPKRSFIRPEGRFPAPGDYVIKYCNQCGECAKVCPTGAITLNGDIYEIAEDLCIQCGACIAACPYDVMLLLDGEKAMKCNSCGACVRACPRGAVYDSDTSKGGRY
ncbi:MAG TPA: 4Fe-4S dicluster domain-containing protein [Bacillota bacterium]|nr:4Fe-4S dicluster domain-containing protein [Bacillota bacterium]HOG52917.1 4Fe-4S dicluster domain-containing protein [Bacillota bacterium]